MSDSSGGSKTATTTTRPKRASAASLHTAAGLQRSLAQFATASTALTTDTELAQRVIDAVHTGSSAEVEKVFADLGVTAVATIETFDGRPGTGSTAPSGAVAKASNGSGPTSRTITVTLGFGPFNVSFSFKKETK